MTTYVYVWLVLLSKQYASNFAVYKYTKHCRKQTRSFTHSPYYTFSILSHILPTILFQFNLLISLAGQLQFGSHVTVLVDMIFTYIFHNQTKHRCYFPPTAYCNDYAITSRLIFIMLAFGAHHVYSQGPLCLTRINLIPAWINNYVHFKMWDEYLHFTEHAITYPFWDSV